MTTVGSLFSGIGGLDLGLERAGMTVIWQSEIDPYCSRVLAKHWPDVPNLGDITKVDWNHVERPDLICGGYPCQPFSVAGARQGEADPRHLWPYFADAIRVVRPRWALLENVPGHLSLGFGRVLGDLAELGYDTDWDCIPASAVGAPHLRYRIFVVAHTNSASKPNGAFNGDPFRVVPDTNGGGQRPDQRYVQPGQSNPDRRSTIMADAESRGRSPRRLPLTPRGGDGVLDHDHWAVEPDVGRVAHGIPHRVDRLRALGNAVVPQVAEYVGRCILEAAS
jgi:DNA (cytosine-5)-methyltransferase 1